MPLIWVGQQDKKNTKKVRAFIFFLVYLEHDNLVDISYKSGEKEVDFEGVDFAKGVCKGGSVTYGATYSVSKLVLDKAVL